MSTTTLAAPIRVNHSGVHARPAACDAVLALNPPQAGHPPARGARLRCSRNRCENSVINLELVPRPEVLGFSRLRSVLVPP